MKRILLTTVALAALGSASALAADLPQRPAYKAPMMAPAPMVTWTGCYIGGNIGGAFGNASASAPAEKSPETGPVLPAAVKLAAITNLAADL